MSCENNHSLLPVVIVFWNSSIIKQSISMDRNHFLGPAPLQFVTQLSAEDQNNEIYLFLSVKFNLHLTIFG